MPASPAHLLSVIPASMNAEVEQFLDRAHALDLVLSRDDIVYSSIEGLMIDGMPAHAAKPREGCCVRPAEVSSVRPGSRIEDARSVGFAMCGSPTARSARCLNRR
ncbi:hypothetical protein AXK56_15740 [Tsukamurella pulmonis]|nr:hypothetical protein AXK56_15740 [Tsukamurella pulmonis]